MKTICLTPDELHAVLALLAVLGAEALVVSR